MFTKTKYFWENIIAVDTQKIKFVNNKPGWRWFVLVWLNFTGMGKYVNKAQLCFVDTVCFIL